LAVERGLTSDIRYLSAADVDAALKSVDVPAVVGSALVAHASGYTRLPPEAVMRWTAPSGGAARCLALPGAVGEPTGPRGIKIINASVGNPARGLPRASGLTMLFDAETAQVVAVLAAGRISAERTAAVSLLAARELGSPDATEVGVIGAGPLARAHIGLFATRLPHLRRFHVFDVDRGRAAALVAEAAERLAPAGFEVRAASGAEDAVREADVIVTVTTTTTGYIEYGWLRRGATIVNVSLDDVLPDVVHNADRVIVDDWALVAGDDVRLLGRMARSGELVGPGIAPVRPGQRSVDAELGAVLAGTAPGRASPGEIVLVNPFGLGIEDVAVADEVLREAVRLKLGQWLPR
jgi:ornithine cyclodeaminase